MKNFSISPVDMISNLWANRALILVSAKRDILERYRGSVLGLLWAFINPLLMLAVYTFVFSEVFQAKWGLESSSKKEFALILFSGLICFNFFAECINRAPGLIISNPNYVKKVVFPLEIMPIIILVSGLFHASMGLIVWLIAYIILLGAPNLTLVYLPLILIPFCLFILGLTWFLASLGVFVRDVSQIVGPLITILMFMSPLFYPISALPLTYQNIVLLNPLALILEQLRGVLFWAREPNFLILCISWLVSLMIFWLGFVWFQKTRRGFADVM